MSFSYTRSDTITNGLRKFDCGYDRIVMLICDGGITVRSLYSLLDIYIQLQLISIRVLIV